MVFSAKEMREYARDYRDHGVSIGEWLSHRPKRKPTEPELANAILRACCAVTGSEFTRALSRSRKREDVLARNFAMYILKSRVNEMSLTIIGRYYSRDHSLVIHARKEVDRLNNPRYKDPARELLALAQKEVTMNLEKYVAI